MTKKDSKIFRPYYIYITCALLGMITGVLVTRYAQECREGFCWGQAPFLVMFAGGVLAASFRSGDSQFKDYLISGVLAGILVGLFVSFSGGLYAFLGGSIAFSPSGPPTLMALVPNPLIGALGGFFGLIGALIVFSIRNIFRRIMRN